jgi:outer membrane protein assembly factor BamA
VVFASLGSSNGLFQVGYTRYNLFGPGSFASLALAYNPNNKDFTPTLAAGVPLTVNQSLRATVSWSRTTFRGNGARGDSTQQSGQLDWLYNTTDDPLFPTQGDTVETALLYQRFSSLFKSTVVNVPSSRLDERTWDFSLSGHHYRPLTARQSLAFGFSADAFHFSEDDPFPGNFIIGSGNGYQASVSVTHALDLWQGERARHRGDLRLETSAAYAGSYSDAGLSVLFNQTTLYQLTLGENLVFRSPWAIVRLGVLYHGKVMR